MLPYLSPEAGRFNYCEGCPARDYCLGRKDPDDPETAEWISEVCMEQRGEWSLTYGRIDEDDPSYSVPEPPEPWDEYTPDDDAVDDYMMGHPDADEAPIIGFIDENGNFHKRGAW